MDSDKVVRILSLDGGGIRGVIPARFIVELERKLGKPLNEVFHMVAGTSTGGILSLGLTKPTPLRGDELLQLYTVNGSTIFSDQNRLSLLYNPKWNPAPLERLLAQKMGDATIGQTLNDVLITSYDLQARNPHFFKSWYAKLDPQMDHYQDYYLRDVARSTSAAPTYFPPALCPVKAGSAKWAGKKLPLVDGGVFANNPTMCAYAEAQRRYPGAKVLIVSVGTGVMDKPFDYDTMRTAGTVKWATPAIDIMMDGAADAVHYQLYHVLKPSQYFRFQIDFHDIPDGQRPWTEMDETRPANITALTKAAELMLSKNADRFEELAAVLSTPKQVLSPSLDMRAKL